MNTKRTYDAIIVGARAAGAATAMLLARRGLRVLAVDRALYGSDTLSTHAMMRPAIAQLHRWGLLDRIWRSDAMPIETVTFHYPDESVPVAISPADGVTALCAPRRTVLDAIVVDAASEAGAEMRFGVIVDDLARDRHGRVTGIVARDRQGEVLEIDADVVIGADGIRSIVAQCVAARTIRLARNGGAVVYGYYEAVDASGYEWAYAPGVSAGLIPTNGQQTCVFVGGSEQTFRDTVFSNLSEGFDETLLKASPDLAARVGKGRRVGRLRGFAGVKGYAREAHGPGWLLVGDAGYFRDPITTHGISDAFRDAELVSLAVAGETSMSDYQEQREAVTGELFEVTDRIAGYDWTMGEIRTHLREVSRAMRPEMELIRSFDENRLVACPDRATVGAAERPDGLFREVRATIRSFRRLNRILRSTRPSRAERMSMNVIQKVWPNGIPAKGQTAERTRTVRREDIELFTEISGDRNPLHYDEEAARESKFGEIIVQGGVTSAILNAVVAEDLPGPGTVFLHVDWNFRAPVRPGDEITGKVEVLEVRSDKPITRLRVSVTRDDGTIALDGEALCYTMALKLRQ